MFKEHVPPVGDIPEPPVLETIIGADEKCSVGFGTVILAVDGKELWNADDEHITVGMLETVFARQIERGKRTTLFFNAPLWDALFVRRCPGQWVLAEQGRGFA